MFSRIVDKKYQIASILSFFSGIAGCYFYFSRKSQSDEKQRQQKNQSVKLEKGQLLFQQKSGSEANIGSMEKWSSLYSQFYFDKNLQSRKVLDNLDSEGISIETIYKYSPLIAVYQYKQFTAQIRRRRRLVRTFNEDQYIRLIMDYEQQVDELVQRSRQQIIYECQIDPDDFSNMKVIFEATQDLTLLIRQSKKSLRNNNYWKKRSIPKQTLQKIVSQQISFIKSKVYERIRSKMQNDMNLSQDEILRVIQALIEDIVYEKFGYEKEEIDYSLNEERSTYTQKEIKELKKFRSELESDIGNINLLSQQSDAQFDKNRDPLSQGLTRSEMNSSFNEDQQNIA